MNGTIGPLWTVRPVLSEENSPLWSENRENRACALFVDGLTALKSDFGPHETMEQLEAGIATWKAVFARIDHAVLAAEARLALRPTEVVIFGNPSGGTPLMQASQTIGRPALEALV